MKQKAWFSTEKITYVALLVALQVILGNVTQIPSIGKQFNFGFLPVAAAGALLGAPAAVIVGGAGGFLRRASFPAGRVLFWLYVNQHACWAFVRACVI